MVAAEQIGAESDMQSYLWDIQPKFCRTKLD